MRTYIVQPNDSPGSIAASKAGCPKCSRDMVLHHGNSSKPRVVHPNGYVTFESLTPGEQLVLPDKWFEPWFDELPPAYFGSLPYADGVTPSPFGTVANVVLGDYSALEVAAHKVVDLATMDDSAFSAHVDAAGAALGAVMQKVVDGSNPSASARAMSVQNTVRWASEHKASRSEAQTALTMAVADARSALNSFYSTLQPQVHS
jgi:hypothetical protein